MSYTARRGVLLAAARAGVLTAARAPFLVPRKGALATARAPVLAALIRAPPACLGKVLWPQAKVLSLGGRACPPRKETPRKLKLLNFGRARTSPAQTLKLLISERPPKWPLAKVSRSRGRAPQPALGIIPLASRPRKLGRWLDGNIPSARWVPSQPLAGARPSIGSSPGS